MGLFDDLLEPIKEIREVSAQFREEVVSSVGEITGDVTQVKKESTALASEIVEVAKPYVQQKPAKLDKRETIQ